MANPPLTPDCLKLNCAQAVEEISQGLRKALSSFRRRGIIVALSGGIDSSVTAALSVKAVGPDRVFGIHMPDKESSPETIDFSKSISTHFGFDSVLEDITPMLDAAGCYRRQTESIRLAIPEYGPGWKSKIVLESVKDNRGFNFFHVVAQSPEGRLIKQRLGSEAYLGIVAATNFKQRVGRVGIPLSLADFDRLARDIPVLVNLMPSGKYLMEDFYYAGGIPVVMSELGDLIHRDHLTVSGKTVAENIVGAKNWNKEVITPVSNPFQSPGSGTVVLTGSLAPDGAVLKISAASPHLLKHRGRARVFSTVEEYNLAADDLNMDIEENDIIVLQNAGPKGYPGFPEVGNVSMPRKLLALGITDMIRISDARMSGTAFGTVVLHVSPEAAVGGPLALVENGDEIEIDVENRRLDLLVAPEILNLRRAKWKAPAGGPTRGWSKLYVDHVMQADKGADLDFLVGGSGSEVGRHSH